MARKGLPASYIKKYGVSKRAWREYRKAHKKTKSPRTRKTSVTRRKGVRRLARRKKRRSGKSITRTAFKWIRIGALAAPAAHQILRNKDNPEWIPQEIFMRYTGYKWTTNEFHWEWLAEGWLPYIMACATTYGIPKLTSILRRL